MALPGQQHLAVHAPAAHGMAPRTVILRRVLVQQRQALGRRQRLVARQRAACGRARQRDGAQESHGAATRGVLVGGGPEPVSASVALPERASVAEALEFRQRLGMGKPGQRGGGGGGGGGGGDEAPGAAAGAADGKVDGAFHSPAFLAAHIARLQSNDRQTWEEFKSKQTEDARKAALEAAQEDVATRACGGRPALVAVLSADSLLAVEFRRQLDMDRAKLLRRAEKEAVRPVLSRASPWVASEAHACCLSLRKAASGSAGVGAAARSGRRRRAARNTAARSGRKRSTKRAANTSGGGPTAAAAAAAASPATRTTRPTSSGCRGGATSNKTALNIRAVSPPPKARRGAGRLGGPACAACRWPATHTSGCWTPR